MLFRNRMLGGVSFMPMFDAAKEGGAGGGGAADAGGAAAGAAAGATDVAAGAADTGGAAAGAAAGAGAGADAGGAAAGAADAGKTGAADPGAAAAAATLAAGGADPAKADAATAAAAAGKGFPENWREVLAGDDKKLLADLAKYTDPNAMYKSLRDLQGQISSGKLKAAAQPLAKDATPEQAAAWRKDNGLPDSPEGYVKALTLPEGVVVGEADKALVETFAKQVFADGGTQAELDRAVSWYYAQQDAVQGQMVQRDGEQRTLAQGELIQEWGADFKTNMNAVGTLLATLPGDFKAELLSARTGDGRMIGDLPGFNRWAAQMAREINPAATLIPPGGNSGETIASEIATIEKSMYSADGKPNPAYWNGKDGEKMQSRYRDLVEARDKIANKGKAA